MGKITVSVAGETASIEYTLPIVNSISPKSYASVADLIAGEGLPTDANYVLWDDSNPQFKDKMLEEVFMGLYSNDILVLPERAQPYLIDSADGFRAAGIASTRQLDGSLRPVVNTYKGKTARTWFAMARGRRGLFGLGPNTVIQTSISSYREGPQPPDHDATQPGRLVYTTSGTVSEKIGCQEKVLEFEHATPWVGNFVMRGQDFGGIAYHGITGKAFKVRRLKLDDAHRGFSGVPNGESGGLSANASNYDWKNVEIICTDSAGNRNASSPFMINNSGGGKMENVIVTTSKAGMPTIWNSTGTHEWINVVSKWNYGHGYNIEKAGANFILNIRGGTLWSGKSGSNHPAPDGAVGNGMHLGLGSYGGYSAKVNLIDVDVDSIALLRNTLCCQPYGAHVQNSSDITWTKNGVAQAVKVFGGK